MIKILIPLVLIIKMELQRPSLNQDQKIIGKERIGSNYVFKKLYKIYKINKKTKKVTKSTTKINIKSSTKWADPKKLQDHYERHGKPFNAVDAYDYAMKANKFYKNRHKYEIDVENIELGNILLANDKQGLFLRAKDAVIEVLEMQAEGSKKMNAKDFLRGNKLV